LSCVAIGYFLYVITQLSVAGLNPSLSIDNVSFPFILLPFTKEEANDFCSNCTFFTTKFLLSSSKTKSRLKVSPIVTFAVIYILQ